MSSCLVEHLYCQSCNQDTGCVDCLSPRFSAGPFQIAALEYSGEFNGEVTFETTLESAGALSFAAI